MKQLRVLLAVTLAVGGVAACGSSSGSGTTSGAAATTAAAAPSPSQASPKDAMLASITAFDTTSYAFHLKQPDATGEGKVDPTKKSMLIDVNGKAQGQQIAIGYTMIGSDLWIKLDLGAAANSHYGINKTKWMHVDRTKIKNTSVLPPLDANGAFALGVKEMLAGQADVKATDATHITGTLDASNPESLLSPDSEILKKIGDKAKAIPFTATLDDKGRLIDLKTDGRTLDPSILLEATFDSFGSVSTITKPAGAIAAPASLYSTLFAS